MKRVAVVYPELLGTYGDVGNSLVLFERAQRRGLNLEVTHSAIGDVLPNADLFLIGGGEDGPQRFATDRLRESSFASQVRDGAHVFAVCAGLQILGQHFAVEGNDAYDGLGLVDAVSVRGVTRSVGDIATRVGDHVMVGFENHGGVTNLGDGVMAFGDVLVGRGNDGQVDGYVVDRIMATYAHGPVLAMNPWLADRLLSALFDTTLSPLATSADKLHQERLRVLGVATNQ